MDNLELERRQTVSSRGGSLKQLRLPSHLPNLEEVKVNLNFQTIMRTTVYGVATEERVALVCSCSQPVRGHGGTGLLLAIIAPFLGREPGRLPGFTPHRGYIRGNDPKNIHW